MDVECGSPKRSRSISQNGRAAAGDKPFRHTYVIHSRRSTVQKFGAQLTKKYGVLFLVSTPPRPPRRCSLPSENHQSPKPAINAAPAKTKTK